MKKSRKSKREILKDKVVELVINFVASEAGLSQGDLERLFGYRTGSEIAAALAEISIIFS